MLWWWSGILKKFLRNLMTGLRKKKYIMKNIINAVDKNRELILNADDPLVVSFGLKSGKKCHYFGVGHNVGINKLLAFINTPP